MKQNLTDAQIETIHRNKGKLDPKELAQRLGVSRKRVEEVLARVRLPVWSGREPRRLLAAGGALLIVVLGYLAYAGTPEHREFHFDDSHAIQHNDAIRTLYQKVWVDSRTDLSPAERIRRYVWAMGPTAEQIYDYNFARMATYWSFALTYYAHPFGHAETPAERAEAMAGWHAANRRIHVFNGLLAFWVAWLTLTAPAFRRSLRAARYPLAAALLAGVVFVTHPLQTQAVTYLTQRTESLCATFYLLSLGLYITARRRSLGDARGSAPWLSLVVVGAGGLLLVLAALVARTSALDVGGLVRFGFLDLAAVVAGLVVLVKTGRDEWVHAACVLGSFAAFAVALQTKEIAATIPLAIVIWELVFVPGDELVPDDTAAPGAGPAAPPSTASGAGTWLGRALRSNLARRVRYLGPWAAIVAGVFVLGFTFGGTRILAQLLAEGVQEGGQATQSTLSAGQYLLTQANVFWTYVSLFLFPFGRQHLDWHYPIVALSPADPHLWLALLSGAGLLTCVALVVLRGGRARVAAFALGLALVVLAPTSTVIVLPDVIFEHRFYLPLFGAALLLAVLAERGARRLLPEGQALPALLGAALVLGAGLAYATSVRNEAWETEVSLWRDVTEKAPAKPRAWTNYGLALQNTEPFELEVRAEGGGVEVVRGLPVTLSDGSVLVFSTVEIGGAGRALAPGAIVGEPRELDGGPDKAIAAYERALELDPDYAKALNNLALVSVTRGHIERQVAQAYAQAIPALTAQGARQEAEAARAAAQEHLAAAERLFRQAEEALLHALRVTPDDHLAQSNLGNLYGAYLGDYAKAEEHVMRSVELGGPRVGLVVAGGIAQQRGVDAYHAASREGAAPQEALARARDHWQRARARYRDYLAGETGREYRRHARERLQQVERFLGGAAPPPPGAGGAPQEVRSHTPSGLPGPGGR